MTGTIHDKQAWLDRLDAAKIAAERTSSTTIEDTSQRRITDYFGQQALDN